MWATSTIIGALLTWGARHNISADGISYLDVGERFAVNGMWSFLYSWMLGVAESLFQPTAYWKYPLAHAVNFLLFLFALWTFNLLLKQIPHSTIWFILAHIVFLYSSLVLIPVDYITADILVAGCVYLSSSLLLRVNKGEDRFVALGACLGLGYLAKLAMLPLGLVFAMVTMRKSWIKGLSTIGAMLAVSAIYIVPLSIKDGHFTWGDSGKINYAWYVSNQKARFWQGGPNSPRIINENPTIYEFNSTANTTYSVWYDPPFWYRGVESKFEIRSQIPIFLDNLKWYFGLEFRAGLMLLFLTVVWLLSRKRILGKEYYLLLIPCFAAFAMFAMVHVEPRYVAPFVTIIFLLSEPRNQYKKLISCLIIIIFAGYPLASYVGASATGRRNSGLEFYRVAVVSAKLGLSPGDRIGSIGYANAYNVRWAKLADVKVVAEIYEGDDISNFVDLPESMRQKAYDAFRSAGAKAIFTHVPISGLQGWERIEGTRASYYLLK